MSRWAFSLVFFFSSLVFASGNSTTISPFWCSHVLAKLVNFRKTRATGYLIGTDVPERKQFNYLELNQLSVGRNLKPQNFVGKTGYVSLWHASDVASLYDYEYGVTSKARFVYRYHGEIVSQSEDGVLLKLDNGRMLNVLPRFDRRSKRVDTWSSLMRGSRNNTGWDGDLLRVGAYQGKILTFLPDKEQK